METKQSGRITKSRFAPKSILQIFLNIKNNESYAYSTCWKDNSKIIIITNEQPLVSRRLFPCDIKALEDKAAKAGGFWGKR